MSTMRTALIGTAVYLMVTLGVLLTIAYGQAVIPWTKDGSTKADFDRDGRECYEQAITTQQFPQMQQLVFGKCMSSKGWVQETGRVEEYKP